MNNFGQSILGSSLICGILSLVSIAIYCLKSFSPDNHDDYIYLVKEENEHNKDCFLEEAIDEGLEIVNEIGKEDFLNALQSGLLQ